MLYIGRATKRFLNDSEGQGHTTNLELEYLKPHVGNDTIMEEYQEDQEDMYIFHI